MSGRHRPDTDKKQNKQNKNKTKRKETIIKKLTAGVFAAILTVVGVGVANAEIASKQYVDDKVTAIDGVTGGLSDTVGQHTEAIAGLETNKVDKSAATKVDNAQNYQYVSAVSQTDGVISVERAGLNVAAVSGLQDELNAKLTGAALVGDFTADGTGIPNAGQVYDYMDASLLEIVENQADQTGQITALQNKDAALDKEITALKGADTTLTTNVGKVQGEVDAVETRVGTAEGKITTLESAKVANDTKNSEQDTAIGAAQASANKANTDLASVVTQVNANLANLVINPGDCTNEGARCVLTYDGTGFAWEVVARGDKDKNGTPDTATQEGAPAVTTAAQANVKDVTIAASQN